MCANLFFSCSEHCRFPVGVGEIAFDVYWNLHDIAFDVCLINTLDSKKMVYKEECGCLR